MTKHNGYVLEQLFSPLIVVSTPVHQELLELGKGCVTRPTVRHYRGFARGGRKRLGGPEPTVTDSAPLFLPVFTFPRKGDK